MRWQSYRKAYYGYELSVSQTRVLTVVAGEAVKEFPNRLPEYLRRPLVALIVDLARSTAKSEAEREEISANVEDTPGGSDWGKKKSKLFGPWLDMAIASGMMGGSAEDVDFERLLCSQELVMLFTHLNAFMADSLRAICQVCPEVLGSGKQIDWATALSFHGRKELVDHLTERYVFEFGWESVPKRLEFLRKELGLAIECPGSDLELIEAAENIRNIVVHNGGRVDQQYIEKTGQNELVIGELVPVTSEYVVRVSTATRLLVGELFVQVSKKFFHVDDSKLMAVWRRSEPRLGSKDNGT
jgi:hypothetical protein